MLFRTEDSAVEYSEDYALTAHDPTPRRLSPGATIVKRISVPDAPYRVDVAVIFDDRTAAGNDALVLMAFHHRRRERDQLARWVRVLREAIDRPSLDLTPVSRAVNEARFDPALPNSLEPLLVELTRVLQSAETERADHVRVLLAKMERQLAAATEHARPR